MWKRMLTMILALVLVTGLLSVGAEAENLEYTLLLDTEKYSVYTDTVHPWTASSDGFTSGNANQMDSFSTLKIVAKQEGLLSFDWTISSYCQNGFTTAYFAYQKNAEFSADTDVTNCENQAIGIASDSEPGIAVTLNDVLYLTYYRIDLDLDDYDIPHSDLTDSAVVANISITDYSAPDQLVPVVFDETMGSVTVQWSHKEPDEDGINRTVLTEVSMSEMELGKTYVLTATPSSGNQFYGWLKYYQTAKGLKTNFEGHETPDGDDYEITVNETTYYTPVFAPKGSYLLRKNAEFYGADTDLSDVLNNAARGDTVVLLENAELTKDATVPSGVHFYLPFRANWGSYEKKNEFNKNGGNASLATTANAYVTLTVPEGKTLTVQGTLTLGAVISSSSHNYQGHCAGAHGRVLNNGTLLIDSSGVLVSWGLIDGTGVVHAVSGGIVKEPFIVCDFTGGSNTADMFGVHQMPFRRFSMQNIQCLLEMEQHCELVGLCNLYAAGMYNDTEISVVGENNAVFTANGTARSEEDLLLVRTYEPGKTLSAGTTGNGTLGIGKTTWRVGGGLSFRPMTLDLYGLITLTTEDADFPIPYNMDFIMENGVYDIPGRFKIMPGATVTIAETATLNLSGRLLTMDGIHQEIFTSKTYPSAEELAANGFPKTGNLIVNGTLHVFSGATLAGVIQTTGETGMLIIEEGAFLNNSGDLASLDPKTELWNQAGYQENDWIQQDGGHGYYSDNTAWFNLPARVFDGETIKQLEPGTFKAKGTDSFVLESFQERYCTNGGYFNPKDEKKTYPYLENGREMSGVVTLELNQELRGVWANSTSTVDVAAPIVAGGETNGIEVQTVTWLNEDGDTVLQLSAIEKTSGEETLTKYVHLVQWTAAGAEPVTVTPEEDGIYIIPKTAVGVTVESAMLGDTDLDGVVSAADAAKILRGVAGLDNLSELQELTACVDSDEVVSAADAAKLLRVVAGLDSGF